MSDIFIQPMSPLQQLNELQNRTQKSAGPTQGGFAETLKQTLQEVDGLQKVSDEQIRKVLSGEVKDVHTAMIAMQKADLSFQVLMQVRNKLIEAYQEVMRMQV